MLRFCIAARRESHWPVRESECTENMRKVIYDQYTSKTLPPVDPISYVRCCLGVSVKDSATAIDHLTYIPRHPMHALGKKASVSSSRSLHTSVKRRDLQKAYATVTPVTTPASGYVASPFSSGRVLDGLSNTEPIGGLKRYHQDARRLNYCTKLNNTKIGNPTAGLQTFWS